MNERSAGRRTKDQPGTVNFLFPFPGHIWGERSDFRQHVCFYWPADGWCAGEGIHGLLATGCSPPWRVETLLGNASLELQYLREFVQSVRQTRDMLTDHFAETEGAAGPKSLVAAIRTVLTEDLEEVPSA